MLNNRSLPVSGVIPVLGYADVSQAAEWLCQAFDFRERLVIGAHRVQLHAGSGAVVVTGGAATNVSAASMSIMVRVADAHAHFERAKAHGATIIQEPTDYPYGERQFRPRPGRVCMDVLANHRGRRSRRLGRRAQRAVI